MSSAAALLTEPDGDASSGGSKGRCAVMLASPWATAMQPLHMLPHSHHTNVMPQLGSGLGLECCHSLSDFGEQPARAPLR